MFRTLLLLFLFAPVFVLAQPAKKDQRWGISFTPAIVPSPFLQLGIQPGIEYKINKRLFLLTEITFSTHPRNIDSSALDRKYFRIKPELRYVVPGNRLFEKYIGFQLSYSSRSFKDLNSGTYFTSQRSPDTTVIAFDQARIASPVITASFQVGAFFPITKNFLIDVFAGTGTRNVNTKYKDVVNPRTTRYMHPVDKAIPVQDPAWSYNGSVYRFHFNTGFRLLYRFGRN
ncbi:MAG: hypothetical protein Q8941_22230 [Bacteroidota bacterium]|nr:hypothetical protein [Bacteroidota bacterium]